MSVHPLPSEVICDGGFRCFYEGHYRSLLALSVALCGSWTIGEDLVQEAFVSVARSWHKLDAEADRVAWVRRVVANRAASHFRRVFVERRFSQAEQQRSNASPDQSIEDVRVWDEVRKLPRRQRQAIAFRYAMDLSQAEVALAMGVSEETVQTHLKRARATLGHALRDEVTDHGP